MRPDVHLRAGERHTVIRHYLFDWGGTLMLDDPGASGPMYTWSEVEAVPGARDVLAQLSRDHGCHIATNARDSGAGDIRRALDRVGLGEFIDRIFCFRVIGAAKPSAEFFGHILSVLRCDRSDVLMVGDDLEKDVIGASRFGIPSVWFNPGARPVPVPTTAIESLAELLPGGSFRNGT